MIWAFAGISIVALVLLYLIGSTLNEIRWELQITNNIARTNR